MFASSICCVVPSGCLITMCETVLPFVIEAAKLPAGFCALVGNAEVSGDGGVLIPLTAQVNRALLVFGEGGLVRGQRGGDDRLALGRPEMRSESETQDNPAAHRVGTRRRGSW